MGGERSIEQTLSEQLAYYRARAGEYDEWFLRRGRYDRGAEANRRWFSEVEEVRDALAALLPTEDVLELACGTGLWTVRLAAAASRVTCIDASPEVIALNEARLRDEGLLGRVTYEAADLFAWQPQGRYTLVFFGFWLSHVPEPRFERFWQQVGSALAPGGRVFFVDNRASSGSQKWARRAAGLETRGLNDGREFEIVKVFHAPDVLQQRLATLGFRFEIRETDRHFIYGVGERM
jgi:demethylmenaquinone methyltransferase/2-methoxy-6-polyprenyl-1,4-benzoquinol methylase